MQYKKEDRNYILRNINYLRYVIHHKWLVFIEACKLGIPWRGILHDLSKFTPAEWGPRAAALGKSSASYLDEAGWYRPENVDNALAAGWLHHYHHNRHHWQWWVVHLDARTVKVLPMTDPCRREMLADWRAVARMPGRQAMFPWYRENKDKMLLHPETRAWLEKALGFCDTEPADSKKGEG